MERCLLFCRDIIGGPRLATKTVVSLEVSDDTVVRVNMLASRNGLAGKPDELAVFENALPYFQRPDSDFMHSRNIFDSDQTFPFQCYFPTSRYRLQRNSNIITLVQTNYLSHKTPQKIKATIGNTTD